MTKTNPAEPRIDNPVAELGFPRGSEWRLWDLHIHTPASYHWEGPRFGDEPKTNDDLLKKMIAAMEVADPAVYGIMDYWTFEGWFRIKDAIERHVVDRPTKSIFPGIELRLSSPTKHRLNAHALFSDKISNQTLKNFQSTLRLKITDEPLSEEGLINYAKAIGDDKLRRHGFTKESVLQNRATALSAGYVTAELSVESYQKALNEVPAGQALGFIAFDTYGGLKEVDLFEDYAYALSLFKSSPIFETRDVDQWAAFAGVETEKNKRYIAAFQSALDNQPRLAVSGSDAHRFVSDSKNNEQRGYGDFPSNARTWLKADPTWAGLKQVIREPAARSFIGIEPSKVTHIKRHESFFIDMINIDKKDDSGLEDVWLHGCALQINSDLVAIIGNKGSGKSALSDVIGFLGNSNQNKQFTFLKRNRFLGKSGEPARHFEGVLTWKDGNIIKKGLSDDPSKDGVELIRYIPQGQFETLCNDHVSGETDVFESELRQIVFEHVSGREKLGALNFEQLIEKRESTIRVEISEARRRLSIINRKIVQLSDEMRSEIRAQAIEAKELKAHELRRLLKQMPPRPIKPESAGNEADDEGRIAIQMIREKHNAVSRELSFLEKRGRENSLKISAINDIRDRLRSFERYAAHMFEELKESGDLAGIDPSRLVSIHINYARLASDEVRRAKIESAIERRTTLANDQLEKLAANQVALAEALDRPNREFEAAKQERRTWITQFRAMMGSKDDPKTYRGIKERLRQLDNAPKRLVEAKTERLAITKEIGECINRIRQIRSSLFAPLQELIENNPLIRERYELQFQANIVVQMNALVDHVFSIVKKNIGELRGDDEAFTAIQKVFDEGNVSSPDGIVSCVQELERTLMGGIDDLQKRLRKGSEGEELLDYLYGISYLQAEYTIEFQGTSIEQLSPGQRGALLLIFYLLVDGTRRPIILDQPEENLDNETVVSLLVPVIQEAKKKRQIIMVTHNPNLAVVCDAEQIISAEFDRDAKKTIRYVSGSIESEVINKRVVNILEGTQRAFDNRGGKYIKDVG